MGKSEAGDLMAMIFWEVCYTNVLRVSAYIYNVNQEFYQRNSLKSLVFSFFKSPS